ncbi:MAG: hypothetical protein EBR09_15040 [Proteobacteria bacterium]|nr:hypothetical protein [Pseudomonadota bacterium]
MFKTMINTCNTEIIRSLIYSLEGNFPGSEFYWNDAQKVIEHNHPEREVEEFVSSFLSHGGRLSDRVSSACLVSGKQLAPLSGDLSDFVLGHDVDGTFFLREGAEEVIQLLDQGIRNHLEHLSSEAVHIPSLISEENLIKAGYLPRDAHQVGTLKLFDGERRGYGHVCLTPALCLSAYPCLAKSGQDQNSRIYTSIGMVHRFENGRFSKDHSLSRMREFRVREYIGFGSPKWIEGMQKIFLEFWKLISTALELPFEVCTATDIFFHAEQSRQAMYQLMHSTKLELRVQLESGPLSVSSFNRHEDHFIKSFGIRCSAEMAGSFCIGFGLERLAQCVLLRWPERDLRQKVLRDFISSLKAERP